MWLTLIVCFSAAASWQNPCKGNSQNHQLLLRGQVLLLLSKLNHLFLMTGLSLFQSHPFLMQVIVQLSMIFKSCHLRRTKLPSYLMTQMIFPSLHRGCWFLSPLYVSLFYCKLAPGLWFSDESISSFCHVSCLVTRDWFFLVGSDYPMRFCSCAEFPFQRSKCMMSKNLFIDDKCGASDQSDKQDVMSGSEHTCLSHTVVYSLSLAY